VWEGRRIVPFVAIAVGILVCCCIAVHKFVYRNDPDDLGTDLGTELDVIDAYREIDESLEATGDDINADDSTPFSQSPGAVHARQAWGGAGKSKSKGDGIATLGGGGGGSKKSLSSSSFRNQSKPPSEVRAEVESDPSDEDTDDEPVVHRVQSVAAADPPTEEDELGWSVRDRHSISPVSAPRAAAPAASAASMSTPAETSDPVVRSLQTKLAAGTISQQEYDQIIAVLQQDDSAHIAAKPATSFKRRTSYNRSGIREKTS
jgi:hypothetical protein